MLGKEARPRKGLVPENLMGVVWLRHGTAIDIAHIGPNPADELSLLLAHENKCWEGWGETLVPTTMKSPICSLGLAKHCGVCLYSFRHISTLVL